MGNNYFTKRICCPGCKSDNHHTIYSCGFLESPVKDYIESFYASQGGVEFEYLKGNRFILKECIHCKLIYQEEIPNEFLTLKLYEEWIDPVIALDQHLKMHALEYYSAHAQEIMILIAYFNRIPNQFKFLDFGMGWGAWAIMAGAFGCDSYGTELSRCRQEYARSHGVNVITWGEVRNHSFDFINTEQVFEHVSDPLENLIYLVQSLKPGGIVKISVPDGSDIKRRLKISDWSAPKYSKNSLNSVSPLEHINCFNRASLIKMADGAGLEQVKIPLTIQYTHTANWRPIKLALKSILFPIYRNVLNMGTYIFFRQKCL